MIECTFCAKHLSTKSNLTKHIQTCKQKKLVEYQIQLQTQREQYERELQTQREQYERALQIQLQNQRDQFQIQCEQYELELRIQREQLEKLETQIFEIAKQPKQVHNNQSHTTTNNNQKTLNLVNQLAPMDFNPNPVELAETIRQAFTEDIFFEGPSGIARLVVENLLIDQQTDKFRMVCSDSSRKHFKYTDEEGEIKTDHGMNRLHDMVKKPLSDANMEIYLEATKGVGDHTRDRFRNLRDRNDGFIMNRHQMSDKIISEITK